MNADTKKTLLIGGAAVAGYFLFVAPGGAAPFNFGTGTAAANNPASGAVPTTYGINTAGGVANYAALAQANPNLLNPNYHMTLPEAQQYLSNYLDLQQGLPGWVNHKVNGVTTRSLPEAAQLHWTIYGCAEKRIFLPLQPPSIKPYVPPPANPKSSGSGVFGTLLKAVTIAAGGVITVATGGAAAPLVAAGESAALTAESAIHGTSDLLNDAECQILFQGAAILNDVLPIYGAADPVLVATINNRLNELLTQYS